MGNDPVDVPVKYMKKRCKFFRPSCNVHSAMAKSNNLPAKIYKAGERTETTLRFEWDAGADGGTVYIDLAKALSIINRRAYRQGLYYYVASVSFSNGTTAYCQVQTIPDTYMSKISWVRGYKTWSEMNRRANAGMSNVTPKYHDFKVLMDADAGTTLDPCRGFIGSTTTYAADDWVISQFVTEDPYLHGGAASDTPVEAHNADQFTAHMLGDHTGSSGAWTSIGLIQSAQDVARNMPGVGEPTFHADADTDPIANLFDAADTHDDVRLNMDEDNDEPPYNSDLWVGSTSKHETTVGALMRVSAGAGAVSTAPGFVAPLGLLQVNTSDFGDGAQAISRVELIVKLVPGTYNGVYAERIL
jgi:hypothetical protein